MKLKTPESVRRFEQLDRSVSEGSSNSRGTWMIHDRGSVEFFGPSYAFPSRNGDGRRVSRRSADVATQKLAPSPVENLHKFWSRRSGFSFDRFSTASIQLVPLPRTSTERSQLALGERNDRRTEAPLLVERSPRAVDLPFVLVRAPSIVAFREISRRANIRAKRKG